VIQGAGRMPALPHHSFFIPDPEHRFIVAKCHGPQRLDCLAGAAVGSRVRMRRKMLAMSQTQLANALGITYQQVQKNESGTNRIGASRLQKSLTFCRCR
jgi:DNA-binding XRE family transcriptional regulator